MSPRHDVLQRTDLPCTAIETLEAPRGRGPVRRDPKPRPLFIMAFAPHVDEKLTEVGVVEIGSAHRALQPALAGVRSVVVAGHEDIPTVVTSTALGEGFPKSSVTTSAWLQPGLSLIAIMNGFLRLVDNAIPGRPHVLVAHAQTVREIAGYDASLSAANPNQISDQRVQMLRARFQRTLE